MTDYERSVRVYRMTLEDLYEDLVIDKIFPSQESLAWEIDELTIFRYKLTGEEVETLDKKYLPVIYEVIKKHYPNLIDFFEQSLKYAGVDLSIFEKSFKRSSKELKQSNSVVSSFVLEKKRNGTPTK